MDPAKNADYAAGMLSGLIAQYGGVRQALSAYNAGSPHATGTVTTWGDGSKLGYADSVLRHYADLGGDLQALGVELAAGRNDAAPAANALAGIAAAATGASTAGAGDRRSRRPTSAASQDAGGLSAAAGGARSRTSRSSLPQPSPYPSQYRSYTSVSGMDSNGPQQIDTMMAGLIDGADGADAPNDAS